MVRVSTVVFSFVACAAILAASSAAAYWVPDGTAICAAAGTQNAPQIASDGAGGAIVVWYDQRDGSADIYAQRVDASGVPLWSPDGVAICAATASQLVPVIVSDGMGGAVIAWQDNRGLSLDIYAQRVNSSGIALWPADGVAVCAASLNQSGPRIVADGGNGAIVVWLDSRNGGGDIYAQRVSGAGTPVWPTNGVALCSAAGDQWQYQIASDGAGGAIVAWSDPRSGEHDIYARRVTAYGGLQWTSNGVALCTAVGFQFNPVLVADGAGGAVVAWSDGRSGANDIYAQKVSAAGAAQWTADGLRLCGAGGDQNTPAIASDGFGGAVVTWEDVRTGSTNIYAQSVNASGTVQWSVDGAAVCPAAGNRYGPRILGDGAGGAIVAWMDYRSGESNYYAQKLNSSGGLQWAADGLPLCLALGGQGELAVADDGAGGFVAVWYDDRNRDYDIYAQVVDSEGRAGFLAPEIHSIRDVPGDQGGLVNLTWYAARSDVYMDGRLSFYSIWRAIDSTKAALPSGVVLDDLSQFDPTGVEPVFRIEQTGTQTFFWELIQTVDALYMPAYGKPVPTLFDSTAVCTDPTYFQVVAHTAVPTVFWKSEPGSGYSVDNLAPVMPTNILAGYQADGVVLDWDDAPEADFRSFLIFRSTDPYFVPSAENLVQEVITSEWMDPEAQPWGNHYKIITVDQAGNESPAGSPAGMSGLADDGLPSAPRLLGAVPNPFNPTTRLSFELAAAGHVRLRVYDAAGRLVATLVNEYRPTGRNDVMWDGRNSAGHQLATGIYMYRLEAAGTVLSRSMALVK